MKKRFESLSHTADIKIRVYGKTKEDLFRNALFGMFQSINPEIKGCHKQDGLLVCSDLPEQKIINIQAPSLDLLLIDFLSEALYLSDVYHQAYFDVDIAELRDTEIQATLHGIKVDGFDVEIKAVTYHDLDVQQIDGMWQAIIVFDI